MSQQINNNKYLALAGELTPEELGVCPTLNQEVDLSTLQGDTLAHYGKEA